MTAKFKPGDLVRHKTGGPVMCVVVAEAEATCHWWQNGNFHEFPIPVTALEHHEPVDGDGIEQGEPEPFQKTDLAKYPNLWDGPGPPEANAGALGKPECRNCGMHAEDHDNGVCPGGETRERW